MRTSLTDYVGSSLLQRWAPHPVGHRGLFARIALWAQARQERRELAGLSDRTLADIGLSRGDVDREYLRAFWQPVDYRVLDALRHQAGY